ncbi:MAG TPA: hypothetical protein VE224_08150, partial [Pseudolabrys sp.]|nr:hypothetical protein [Pseudolabrys sp.]
LQRWAAKNTNFAQARNGLDDAAGIAEAVAAVLRAPRKAPVAPSGIAEAIDHVRRFIASA